MSVKVLSLFDGMACGMLAMKEAGIAVERYVAYEIDEYAVATVKDNFPIVEECGDVFKADFKQYAGFDFLIGGSPCTYWSVAQRKDKRETEAHGIGWQLFQQYVRALHEAKPKYFIYENNKSMSKEVRDSITKAFGFEPVYINSGLFTAQNRQRLYWVGKCTATGEYERVELLDIEDKGILIKDILDDTLTAEEHELVANEELLQRAIHKSDASQYDKLAIVSKGFFSKGAKTKYIGSTSPERAQGYRVYDAAGKSSCIRGQAHDRCCELWLLPLDSKPNTIIPYGRSKHGTLLWAWHVKTGLRHRVYMVKNGYIQINRRKHKVNVADGYYIISKPLMSELRRLQGVPDWYSFEKAGNAQACKLMGNGWTIPLISHLIKSCKAS